MDDLVDSRALLRQLRVLAEIAPERLDPLADLVTVRELAEGDELVRQGAAAHAAYLVLRGELNVVTNGRVQGAVGPGDLVGEAGLLASGPRMSTITARAAARVLVFDERAFGMLLQLPEVAVMIATETARRLRTYAETHQEPKDGRAWESLTPAQQQVARLVAQGLSNAAVAEQLVLSKHTVESHLKHIFTKLGIRSRVALAIGVVPPQAR